MCTHICKYVYCMHVYMHLLKYILLSLYGVRSMDVFRAGHLISNNQLMCFSLWKTILFSEFFMNLREIKKGCIAMLRETKGKKKIQYLHDNLNK